MTESTPERPNPDDPAITITLPLTTWQTVMALVGRGAFCAVESIVRSMAEQSEPQLAAAKEAQRKEVLTNSKPRRPTEAIN